MRNLALLVSFILLTLSTKGQLRLDQLIEDLTVTGAQVAWSNQNHLSTYEARFASVENKQR